MPGTDGSRWTRADPSSRLPGASVVATSGYDVGLTDSRRRFAGHPPLTVAFGQLVAATVILAPGALLTVPRGVPSVDVVAAVFGLGLLCTAIGLAAPVPPRGGDRANRVEHRDVPRAGIRCRVGHPVPW